MADPQPPKAPDDAPQELKDFLDCKADVLIWKPGKVNWLGLPVDPDVSFEQGPTPGSLILKITIGSPPFGLTFSVPASVTIGGELAVDTSKIPDAVPGKEGLDQWVKNLNAWFAKNSKELKRPVLKGGSVTLGKIDLIAFEDPTTPPVVLPKPTNPLVPGPTPPPTPAPTPAPAPGGKADDKKGADKKGDGKPGTSTGCLGIVILVLILALAACVAVATGAIHFGGPSVTASPEATQQPTVTATPAPTPSPTPSLTPVATSTPIGIERFCVRVVHQPLNQFVSRLDWSLRWNGAAVADFALLVKGANDDRGVLLRFDQQVGAWHALLGLHEPGLKTIVRLLARYPDGSVTDVTPQLTSALGGDTFTVRFPEEDTFGDCPI